MDFWTEAPPEWRALACVGGVAALLVASLLFDALRSAANSMLLSESELKRDQAARERRRRLQVLQGRRRRSA